MRVLVIGAGITGLAAAWALTKRGHEVTVLEQAGSVPNPNAASGDQHRIIREAYGLADYYAHAVEEAFDAWDELWRDLGGIHYCVTGILGISRQPQDNAELLKEGLDRLGKRYALLSPDEAGLRYPFLNPGSFRYAFLSERGGILYCRRIARSLADWLVAHRADLRLNQTVVAADMDAGAVETSDGKIISADRVIVAAGAWTLSLFPQLSGTLRIFGTSVVYLEPPGHVREAWQTAPAVVDIGGATDGYVVPPRAGTGLKMAAGSQRRPIRSPETMPVPGTEDGEQLRNLFGPVIADISEYRVAKVASCSYTFTSDGRFFATAMGRFIIVSACSGHGYKFGAAVGRRIAGAVELGSAQALAEWLSGSSSNILS